MNKHRFFCFFLILIAFFVLALPSRSVWGKTAFLTISSDPGADSFTDATAFAGRFNVSVSGDSWIATVHLQRSFEDGTTWVDVDSFSSNIEAVVDEPQRGGLLYRIGIKDGNYTSGTVVLRLTK